MVFGREAGFDEQGGDEGVDSVERWRGRLVAAVSVPRGVLQPGAPGVGPLEPCVLGGEGGPGGRPGVLEAVGVVDLADVFRVGNPIWTP